jgi:lactoylglutathione lyase
MTLPYSIERGFIVMAEFQPKFLHTRIRVKDLNKTVEFYTKLFGFSESGRHISPAGNQLCFLTLPGNETQIELAYSPDNVNFEVPEDLIHFAITVPDLEGFRKKWEPTGIEFWPDEGPVGGRFYFIDDPDGYEIEVMKD